ncbi:hypothetical protein EBZ39_05045 [bacterium]|nr:hypothetical protein [bacterium]
MKTWRKWLVLALAFVSGCVFAAVVNGADTDAEKIRAVLEDNFQACNKEDLELLMDTQARGLCKADLDQFRQEAKDMFADTDVYLRLEEFELVKKQLPFAAARVVQVTLPADENVRNNPNERQRFYRNHTMLLPEYERVEYIQTFKKEGGKWRLWQIVTKPSPVEKGGDRQTAPVVADCPNGQCRKQRPSSTTSVFK